MAYIITSKVEAFFQKLIDMGAFEGKIGQQSVNKDLEPGCEIALKTLAGAKLDVSIKELTPPDAQVYSDLLKLYKEALDETNQENAKAGKMVAAMP